MEPKRALLVSTACTILALCTVIVWQAVDPPAASGAVVETDRCADRMLSGATRTGGGGGLMIGADLRELSVRSARIVTGTVESFRTCRDDATNEFITSVIIAAQQHLKSPPGESSTPAQITVDVPGGQIGKVRMAAGTSPEFTVGEQVVVFLRQVEGGRLRLTADVQGKFSVAGGEVQRAALALESFAARVRDAVAGRLSESQDPLAAAGGQVVEVAYVTSDYKWLSLPVGYYLNADSSRPGQFANGDAIRTAWNNAFSAWEANTKSDVDFTSLGNTSRTSTVDTCTGMQLGDGFNDVTWSIASAHDAATLAITRLCISVLPATDEIKDADIEFDTDHHAASWRTDGTGSCGSGLHDVESVALHEIGHLLGLGHPANTNCPGDMCPVMNPTYVGVKRTLCQDDGNGAGFLYPAATPTPGPVGGIAELAEVEVAPSETPTSSSGGTPVLAIAAATAAVTGAFALGGAAWYVRRRRA